MKADAMLPSADPFVIAAKGIIHPLLAGPGTASIHAAAKAYSAIAAQLNAAAVSTNGSMTEMGETWRGPSSDTAQAAFRQYAKSLREQADVALKTSTLLKDAEAAYKTAHQAMLAVQAELIEFEARQTAMAAASVFAAPVVPTLMLMESESAAILAAAIAVMDQYAATLAPILASFPPPVAAQPIVSNSGGPEMPIMTSTSPTNLATRALYSPTSGGPVSTFGGPSSTSGGLDNGPGPGTHQSPTGTTQTTTDPTTAAAPADTTQMTPGVNPTTDNTDSGANGYDSGPTNHPGLYETSPSSPTLAGLNGGVGSSVVIGMTRGGVGSMSGASTGFRMPANWQSGESRAFSATATDAAEAPTSRPVAPRGSVAPEARMRRRRDDEGDTKVSKVIVPGAPQDVPVLGSAPTVGVIEHTDDGEAE
ncbi:PPE domain-containing protein [Nocardia sp. NPDC050630]|uniref:PPE domain-containing protein n=1 Tax=Nocardia sp. NPDC050630 TaxID=3364321 RepID=UPI0037BDD792